ncbi:exodeoxyribonuclease VII small subunit [Niallia circulans]|jgi:exodeoxyribonuclease VII small subunit|uniref:exodeoxyribonuclease VII small subunit n=1 Tax=Niallia circulans TaxID=1397 RepID=UPI00077CB1D4|nr:exodeoxyribonuclease VII small subunit [Niallia circulans]MDR4314459.1 exodeoxyribonuclease VII small subunit [Niallia circulans]MED3839543.1 exodeoxyribonuclease VII small subunit [Niallia circulans]MED4242615.1 exodeoxyribonuclease VII small subunit [Niallia circulans]MED4246593.1 exodeoxyribonuclease VII small subunit [Niallia circulans]PAD24588.1 exodeoxyribonuclease VII small subunit [Niallia circulans]
MATNRENKPTFEEAMEELERIVEKLEEGDVPLEEAINTYKKGMELSKYCHEKLKSVEEQLAEVVLENGKKQPFSIAEEE